MAITAGELKRIDDRFDHLSELILEVKTELTKMIAISEPCRDRVNIIARDLYGNGMDGIKSDVAVLKAKCVAINKVQKTRSVLSSKALIAIAGALVTVSTTIAGIVGLQVSKFCKTVDGPERPGPSETVGNENLNPGE